MIQRVKVILREVTLPPILTSPFPFPFLCLLFSPLGNQSLQFLIYPSCISFSGMSSCIFIYHFLSYNKVAHQRCTNCTSPFLSFNSISSQSLKLAQEIFLIHFLGCVVFHCLDVPEFIQPLSYE